MIKIGDRVKFINDVGVGIVTSIKGSQVTVDREDGFLVPALISELVVVEKEQELAAISRIGVSDYKPGRQGKKQTTPQFEAEKPQPKRHTRYGRITLTSEYEDDDVLDLESIKEHYTRNMAAVNKAALDMDAKEVERKKQIHSAPKPLTNDTSIFDSEDKSAKAELYEEKKVEKKLEPLKATTITGAPAKKRKPEMDVVDLHSHCLLESEAGLSPSDILKVQIDAFKEHLDKCLESKKHGKVIFIHGVGSGKLKYELERTLRHKYPKATYQDASFKEYGYGAIMVIYS